MDSSIDPEVALAIAYAPAATQPALRALFALDAKLGSIIRTTREPLVGEMRLTWWREALAGERTGGGEPLLSALAVLPLDRAELAAMAPGWVTLLEPTPLDDARLVSFGRERGQRLFELAGVLLGANGAAIGQAGQGWALVDLAVHCSDPKTASRAMALGTAELRKAAATRWPVAARPLGIMAHLALRDARRPDRPRRQGSPARLLRALGHRLTGR